MVLLKSSSIGPSQSTRNQRERERERERESNEEKYQNPIY